ncbi:MAG TPA: PAS domain-containing protein [Marmoricola sp.]|nr:PAS domain-containing protein [Marmoricola sp.]
MPRAEPDEATARQILHALGLAVIVTDPAGVVFHWNPAAERLYGWSAEEAVGRNIAELTVSEIGQDEGVAIMDRLRGGLPWSGGFPVAGRNRRPFPALVTDTPLFRDGELVGVVGVTTTLGSALRPMLERLSDATLVLDATGMVTYASPAVMRVFGWDAPVSQDIAALVGPDAPALRDELARVIEAPGPSQPLELHVQVGQGTIWVEAVLTNLMDDPGVRGVVCSLRPNPTREQLEAAETLVGQLERALSSRLVVEQAKGYLAARLRVTPDIAFELLRGYARNHNAQIHAVAQDVVTGRLHIDAE